MTGHDPLDLELQREREELSKREQKARAEQEKADYAWLLAHKQGRRLVWRQLEEAGVFQGIYDDSHARMAYREGVRVAGLKLLSRVMAHCPEMYERMREENANA